MIKKACILSPLLSACLLFSTSTLADRQCENYDSDELFDILTDTRPGCNPLNEGICGLPYPNHVYGQVDPDTQRFTLRYPDVIKTQLKELSIQDQSLDLNSLMLDELSQHVDGFSPGTPAVFRDRQGFDSYCGKNYVAFNLDTGEAISLDEALQTRHRGALVDEVSPATRWPFDANVVVARTCPAIVTHTATVLCRNLDLKAEYQTALDLLETKGYSIGQILALTQFKIRSENNIVKPLATMAEQILATDFSVEDLKIQRSATPPMRAWVTGYISNAPRYEPKDFVSNQEQPSQISRLRFRLTLPRLAPGKAAGAVILAYPNVGSDRSHKLDLLISTLNASRGLATLSVKPSSGGSSPIGGVRRIQNTTTNQLVAYRALQTAFGAIDINEDGTPDINAEQPPFYVGVSFSGIMGTSFAAVVPKLAGMYLMVSGVGVSDIMTESELESHDRVGNDMILKGIAQQHVDYADGINYAHYARYPRPGSAPYPLALAVAKGDQHVPKRSSETLALLAELPRVGIPWFPMRTAGSSFGFVEGYGVRQFRYLVLDPEDISGPGDVNHYAFLTPQSLTQYYLWLGREARRQD